MTRGGGGEVGAGRGGRGEVFGWRRGVRRMMTSGFG